jgi:hypothetical protein
MCVICLQIFVQGFHMNQPLTFRLDAAVREELERLKALSLSQLIRLPSLKDRKITVDDEALVMTIWHEVLPDGEHRLVVQAGRIPMSGLGVYSSADGFAISNAGAVRSLSADELALFK